MKLTPETKEKNRLLINKAAVEEFYKNGYEGASLRIIADELGITAGNFYRYYSGKEEMFNAVVAPAYSKILDVMKSFKEYVIEQQGVDGAFIQNLTEDVVDFISGSRKEIIILFKGSRGTEYADVREKLIKAFIRSVDVLFKKVRRKSKKGQETAIRIMATSMVDSFVEIVSFYKTRAKIADAIEQSIQFHLFGLMSFLK